MLSNPIDRVALLSGGIPLGGSTTFLLNLGGELVRRRVPLLVVSLEQDNPYAEDFRSRGIPLHLENDRTHIFEDRVAAALRVLTEFRPNVAVACLGPSSFEVLRYLPAGVTRFGMIQSDFPENYPPFVPYVPFLDGMIAVSRQIEMTLREHRQFRSVPTHYLPYGIEVPAEGILRPLRRREVGEPIRILYLGRLSQPQKRVRLFPEMARQLRASGLPFEWTIAGDGPERDWLRKNIVTDEGRVRVRLIGTVSYRDTVAILRQHDVFLLASDAEGLPLSLLEAMAHGLVPVVSDLASGVSEVAHRDCAMVVPPANVAGYADAMIWLAQHPAELAAMSMRAAEGVRGTYSVEMMANRWMRLLDESRKAEIEPWPERFHVRAPLSHANALRFTGPMRVLRRWGRSLAAPRPSTPA